MAALHQEIEQHQSCKQTKNESLACFSVSASKILSNNQCLMFYKKLLIDHHEHHHHHHDHHREHQGEPTNELSLDFSSFSFTTIISINDDHEHHLAYHDHHHHGDW